MKTVALSERVIAILCLCECLALLSEDAAHYVIPSVEIVSRYLEILEDSELCGMVFLQTVVAGVRGSGGSKTHSRVKALLKSERKGSVYFANELCRHTFCAQRIGESRKEWNRR